MPVTIDGAGEIGGLSAFQQGAGLTLIAVQSFTAVASVSLDDCFSADYDNYRVMARLQGSAMAQFYVRLRASGTDVSTASSYRYGFTSSNGAVNNQTQSFWNGGYFSAASAHSMLVGDIVSPAVAAMTFATWSSSRQDGQSEHFAGWQTTASSMDGLTLYPASGTFTGTLRVYGYTNGA